MPKGKKSMSDENPSNAQAKRAMDCPPGKEFVFSLPNGKAVGKARNIIEFIGQVKSAPMESVLYHANGNHFAAWLELIGEGVIASKVSKVRGTGPEVRLQIIRCV